MNLLNTILASPWVIRVGWTLVHFLWQGAAVGLALAVALHLLRRHGAPARYAAACGAMALMAILPLLSFMYFGGGHAPDDSAPGAAANNVTYTGHVNLAPAPEIVGAAASNDRRPAMQPAGAATHSWLRWVVTAWLIGVTILSLRLLGGWAHIHRLRHKLIAPVEERWRVMAHDLTERLDIRRAVQVVTSPFPTSPLTMGWLRPIVLLPAAALRQLAPDQVRSILAHELAHVRRHDFLVNILQSLVETVLFYHPVVWWASHRVRVEREYCCDDVAVALCGDALSYARALAQLEETRRTPVPGLAAAALSAGVLLPRIQRLVAPSANPATRREWVSGALTAVLVLGCIGTAVGASVSRTGQLDAAARATLATPETSFRNSGRIDSAQHVEVETAVQPVLPQTAAEPVGGIALLEFEGVGNVEQLGETCAQLHELVYNQLADTAAVRIVDREKLEAVMAELRLSEGGMVDASSAVEAGRLTDAEAFIFGKLMRLGDDWVFTARIIDTETSEVSALRVTSTVAEGVLPLADAVSTSLAARISTRERTSSGPDEARPYEAQIAALRERLKGQALPRVAVKVPESHLGTVVPDPAGENELMAVLAEVGFTVVDVDTFLERADATSWWDLVIGGEASDGAREAGLRQGWRNPETLLHNTRLTNLKESADVFIVGEAFSEYVGENYGFRSCQARVEVKALDTSNETVAAADSRHASAAELGEFVAGKKALRLAGGELGIALAEQLADYWQGRAAMSRPVR